MNPPTGLLPDSVVSDTSSQASLIFVGLDPSMGAGDAQTFLKELSAMLASLKDGDQFSAVVGFGPPFFGTASAPRFGLTAGAGPIGLRATPALSAVTTPTIASDLVIYAMSREQARVAELLRFLTSQAAVKQIRLEDGYQRRDGREQFGFLDGLRNLPSANRPNVVTTTTETEPDGPSWAIGGSYMTYLKIQQRLDAPASLGSTTYLESVIGRRQDDGSRGDQPEHMNPHDEPDFSSSASPSQTSHIRKAGPRGAEQSDTSDVFLFRRGVPFTDIVDNQLVAGLHFVAFSRSLDFIDVVWNDWIMNPDFPTPGTGTDQLFDPKLTAFLASGFFFVPPDDSRFIGAGIFLGPESAPENAAKVVVRKVLLGPDGSRVRRSLKGFGFTVFDPGTGTAVSSEFKTNSAGHAVSPALPEGKTLILRETTNPLASLDVVAGTDVQFGPVSASSPPPAIRFENRFPAPPQPSPYHP